MLARRRGTRTVIYMNTTINTLGDPKGDLNDLLGIHDFDPSVTDAEWEAREMSAARVHRKTLLNPGTRDTARHQRRARGLLGNLAEESEFDSVRAFAAAALRQADSA